MFLKYLPKLFINSKILKFTYEFDNCGIAINVSCDKFKIPPIYRATSTDDGS